MKPVCNSKSKQMDWRWRAVNFSKKEKSMKKKVLMAVVFAAMAICSLAPVSASAAGSGFYGVGKIGATFQEDSNADTGFSGDVGLGYDFLSGSGLFGIEATIGYQGVSITSGGFKFDQDIVPFALTVKGGGVIAEKTRIYAGAGLDLVYVSIDVKGPGIDGSGSDTVFGYHLLGGITYDITNQFFLGLEGKYLWASDVDATISGGGRVMGNVNNFSVMALVGFRF
jgi:opacity protein-like surface antigen